MISYFDKTALLPDGWAENVSISVDDDGWIINIDNNQDGKGSIQLEGHVITAMPNIHSHSFQRAMAGLAEYTNGNKDSFWNWRELMYDFLGKLIPEDMEAIAAQLYVEMLKAGYSCVGEFHYLHHDKEGSAYDDRALTSHHIINAARISGIAITHMLVLYAHGGFCFCFNIKPIT